MAKLNSQELAILDEIAGWKGRKPSFLNRATDYVSQPLSWAAEKLIPEDIRSSGGNIAEKIAEKLQDISKLTVDKNDVLRATKEYQIDSQTILELKNASIFDLDNVAKQFVSQNTRAAVISGAGTGLAGWAGLIADMPAIFMLALRTIHQIGICYGFDLEGENEDESHRRFELDYMMMVFKVATAADVVQKQRALAELKDLEAGREIELTDTVGGEFTARQVSKNATSYISRQLIREIVEQTIKKKALGLVPALGAIFSAGFNYVYLQDVGETAYMLYRERFLLDKKGRKKIINIPIE